MCGIGGYIGQHNAVPVILDGLRRLEYRGYDSTGLAVAERTIWDAAMAQKSGYPHFMLKEIHEHAKGYAAGEMKHGPIALIDETLPVLSTDVDQPRNLAKRVTVP